MRLQDNDYGFDSNLPSDGEEATIEFSSKMVDILSDHIYKDKILAVIRELICNAYDANVEAGKPTLPVRVYLPNRFDLIFAVEDDGIGIPPEKMAKVYLTYGGSTKTGSNDTIGALGLGSKSPIAYTKSSFIVKSRWEGVERTYFIYKDEKGKPRINQVGEEETDRPNGIRVELAVKQQDIYTFQNRLDRFLKYWKKTMPVIVNVDDPKEVLTSEITKIIDGGYWFLEKRETSGDFNGALAVMGNIPYPIEVDAIPNMPENLRVIAQNPFVIDFDLGTLAFQPSREALSFDEFTNKNLIEKLEKVRQELTKTFIDKIFAPGQTQLQFRRNFNKTVTDFAKAIKQETVSDYSDNANKYEWAISMLLNKSTKDTVTYDGYVFPINDLLNDRHRTINSGHQPFGLTAEDTRKNGKTFFHNCSILEFRVKDGMELDYIDIYPESGVLRQRKLTEGEICEFDWKSSVIPNRKEEGDYSSIHRALMNIDKFDVRSLNRLTINKDEVTFIVSDEGGAGENKFKAFVASPHRGRGNYFFVKYNQREADVLQTIQAVKRFIDTNGLKGAEVDVSSNLEDYREPIERIKKDRGTTKLSQYTFDAYPNHKPLELKVAMDRKIDVAVVSPIKSGDEHEQAVFEWDTLKSSKVPFLYVVKRTRSKTETFEPGTSYTRAYIQDKPTAVRLAMHYKLLDDVYREEKEDNTRVDNNGNYLKYYRYTVLVLTDSQIVELKKKGVPLIGLREHVIPKVNALFARHDYLGDITHDYMMEQMDLIKAFYRRMSPKMKEALLTGPIDVDTPNGDTKFMSWLRAYDLYDNNRNKHIDAYAILSLYQQFVDLHARPKLNGNVDYDDQLREEYPLLSMISMASVNKETITKVFEYMATVDAGRMVKIHEELPKKEPTTGFVEGESSYVLAA